MHDLIDGAAHSGGDDGQAGGDRLERRVGTPRGLGDHDEQIELREEGMNGHALANPLYGTMGTTDDSGSKATSVLHLL